MYRLSIFIFVVAMLACPTLSLADHVAPGGGANTSGPIHTISALTLAKNRLAIGWSNEFSKSEAFSDEELIAKAGSHVHAHSTDFVLTSALSASYGITDDLTVSARIPYIYKDNIRSGAHSHAGGITTNSVDEHGDNGGIGDTMLLGQYRFWKEGFNSSVLLGLEIPTGENHAKHDGERLEAEHQAGSGSWDPALGFAVTKQWNGFSFDASAFYLWSTEGSLQTDLGDRATYGIAVSRRVLGEKPSHENCQCLPEKGLDLVLELNGEWYGKEQENGASDRNSGGTQYFLSPGLRYTGDQNWSGHVSVGVPVRNDLRQGHPDADYKITAGISKSF